jgi:molybdopterin-guanine dinucleotide biosynthesis protein A
VTNERVGFVVAGGKSLRMGRDKALLPWGGATLLDHALDRLRAVTREVRILSGAEPRYTDRGVQVLCDTVPDQGPLGGLLAGLATLDDGTGVFLAVDVPFAPADLLSFLLDQAGGHDAVVPVAAGGPQPLCAVYRPSCRPAVERCLSRGDLRMTAFWPEVSVRVIGEDALARFGDAAALLHNLNTPDDYAGAVGGRG